MNARTTRATRRADTLLFGLLLGFTAGMAAMAMAPARVVSTVSPATQPVAPFAPRREEEEGPRLRLGFSFDPPRSRVRAPQVWSARDVGDDLVALAADIRDAKA